MNDSCLRAIPTVVVTTFDSAAEIVHSCRLLANCCLGKPQYLADFESVVRCVTDFGLAKVQQPRRGRSG
ncbi:MAG: hypothetical protein ABI689_13065 [Thermoanaerobaculia bacterium]